MRTKIASKSRTKIGLSVDKITTNLQKYCSYGRRHLLWMQRNCENTRYILTKKIIVLTHLLPSCMQFCFMILKHDLAWNLKKIYHYTYQAVWSANAKIACTWCYLYWMITHQNISELFLVIDTKSQRIVNIELYISPTYGDMYYKALIV